MLSKNTVIDLWHEFEDVPFVEREDLEQYLDKPDGFMGFPWGTTKKEIWAWFDEQYKPYGGLDELLNDPALERRFQVKTPGGIIECYAKFESDDESGEDFPGVFIDIRANRAQLTGKQIGDVAAVVEYDSCTKNLQTVCYAMGVDDPTHIEVYDCEALRPADETRLSNLKKTYEDFKMQWMISHNIKLSDLFSIVHDYVLDLCGQADAMNGNVYSVLDDFSFRDYLEEQGFHGMLWPCFKEWLENEGRESAMTFGDFLDMYGNDIVQLDIYDQDGNEIGYNVEDGDRNAIVSEYSRCGGVFDVTLINM